MRRIRLEKKKAEENNVEKRRNGTESGETFRGGRESRSCAEEHEQNSVGNTGNTLKPTNSDGVEHVANKFKMGVAGKPRNDSFDEAILGLAGIQDLMKDERHTRG